jgi:hypothetical protein
LMHVQYPGAGADVFHRRTAADIGALQCQLFLLGRSFDSSCCLQLVDNVYGCLNVLQSTSQPANSTLCKARLWCTSAVSKVFPHWPWIQRFGDAAACVVFYIVFGSEESCVLSPFCSCRAVCYGRLLPLLYANSCSCNLRIVVTCCCTLV